MRSITSIGLPDDSGVLMLGADGRMGRMLRLHWPAGGALRGQSRRAVPDLLQFDPLTQKSALEQASEGVSVVICLAGVTPAHARDTGDAMSLNTDLALAAISAAPAGARVLVVSSAAVYGAAEGPQFEAGVARPVSEYGHAKLTMERAALEAGQGRVSVLRIGNVAGADAILGGWRAGMMIDRLPDGSTPRRSYIGPRSLAHVMHKLCWAPVLPDIVNVAAPGVVAMGDLLDAAGLEWSARAPQGSVIPEVALDTKALEALYDFQPAECTACGMVEQWKNGALLA
ncbi:MAG: NAD-dependent epimerase/dehydratase family protein [Sulfitobacter sp.]